jgi:hypothetical protein
MCPTIVAVFSTAKMIAHQPISGDRNQLSAFIKEILIKKEFHKLKAVS